jgi:Ankyrin repeats (many copies)/Ankyrin repeats (3 copies)
MLNLEQQRKRAKDLRRAQQSGSLDAAVRIVRHLPRARALGDPRAILAAPFSLSEAQFVVAREAGYRSWPALRHACQDPEDLAETLLDAAIEGRAGAVDAILNGFSGASRRSIHVAAALGDEEAAFALLDVGGSSVVSQPGGRRWWPPLLYVCASRYRREEHGAARAAIAERLLELGASPTGRDAAFIPMHGAMLWDDHDLQAIEAAAGRAASPELVQVLLNGGAHLSSTTVALLQAVRGGNPRVLALLLSALPDDVRWQVGWALEEAVKTGKADFVRMLAQHADRPAAPALHAAIRHFRTPETIMLLLGEAPAAASSGAVLRAEEALRTATSYGNADAAAAIIAWGASDARVTVLDRLLGACAQADAPAVRAWLARHGGVPRELLRARDHALLAWLVRTGRRAAVPLALEAGLDPAVADADGATPLHLAVRAGDADTAILLLRTKPSIVDLTDYEAKTPLEYAVALGDVMVRDRIVRLLLDAGANAAQMSHLSADTLLDTPSIEEELRRRGAVERESPPLLFERAADAIAAGDLDGLRDLLDEEPWLVRARSPRAHRAMLQHYCAANGVEEERQKTPPNAPGIMRLLLDRGADVDATCYMYHGGANTLGLMLTSVYPIKAGLRTALAEVLFEARLRKGGRSIDDLACAAGLGWVDRIRDLLPSVGDHADDPRTRVQILQPAFLWACEFGRVDAARLLLDNGADIRGQGDNGQTALHLAAIGGHTTTVHLLLERGAPFDVENTWGGNPLNHVLWAAVHHDPHVDYEPVIEALVAAGAPVEPGSTAWWRKQPVLFPASKEKVAHWLERGEQRQEDGR